MSITQYIDPIKDAVDKCCNQLNNELDDAQLTIVHFLCGKATDPGDVRKSSLAVKSGYLKKSGGDNTAKHTDVLKTTLNIWIELIPSLVFLKITC